MHFLSFVSPFNTKLCSWPHNMHPPPVFVHHFSFQIVYCLLPTPRPISKASSNLTAFTFIVHVSNPFGFMFGYHYHYSVARFVAKFGCSSPTAEEYSEPAASKVWWYSPQSQVKKKTITTLYRNIVWTNAYNKLKLWEDIDINVTTFHMCRVNWLPSPLFNHPNFMYRFAISCTQAVRSQVYDLCLCLSRIYSKQSDL